jgi:hypothetical protein
LLAVDAVAVEPLFNLGPLAVILTGNSIGDDEVAMLASSQLSRLRWLDLSRNRIEADGAVTLVSSSSLAGLRYLKMSRIWRSESAMTLLKERFHDRVQFV